MLTIKFTPDSVKNPLCSSS